MIEILNISKKYGNHLALDQINLSIKQGEIVGFLGTNGAGKSTLMNIMTGYLSMSEGSIRINGLNLLEKPEKVKKMIGYLPENPPLYMDMTVYEYLKFVCQLKEVPKKVIDKEIKEKMERIKIVDVKHRLIKKLSKGYKQRVGLAQAMLGNPSVLILDEPTVGLDPREMIEIRNLIQSLSKSCTIILSSHILTEISAICNKIMIIDKGKHIKTGTPEELVSHLNNTKKIFLRIKGEEERILDCLSFINGIRKIQTRGELEVGSFDMEIECAEGEDVREEVFYHLVKADLPILMMKNVDASLEDIFLRLTSGERG